MGIGHPLLNLSAVHARLSLLRCLCLTYKSLHSLSCSLHYQSVLLFHLDNCFSRHQPHCVFSSYCEIRSKVRKGLSYSVTVLSTGLLLRLWIAPRLTAYHTLSPGPQLGLQCPFESVTQDYSCSALTPISQPKLTLLLCCV